MKHILRTMFIAIMAIMLLGSCKSKEEKVLNRLQNMSQQIEKHGDEMTSEQWKKLYDEYTDLHSKLLNEKYDFTDEQMRELGRLEGKIGKAFVKHSMSDFGKAAGELIEKGTEFLKGLTGADDDKED